MPARWRPAQWRPTWWRPARWRPARRWDDVVQAPSLTRKSGSPRRGRRGRARGGMRTNARSETSREGKTPRCVEGFGPPRPRPKAHREAAGPRRSTSGRLRERRTPSTEHNHLFIVSGPNRVLLLSFG
jgi:hypothetical protein